MTVNLFSRLKPVIILSLCLLLLVILIRDIFNWQVFHDATEYIILFFFLQSVVITMINNYGLGKKDKNKIQFFLLTTVLRMTISIFSLAIVLVIGIENKNSFVYHFLGFYLTYLIFEISSLMSTLQPKN
jgi:hypothetical protein